MKTLKSSASSSRCILCSFNSVRHQTMCRVVRTGYGSEEPPEGNSEHDGEDSDHVVGQQVSGRVEVLPIPEEGARLEGEGRKCREGPHESRQDDEPRLATDDQ